jgi:hypothetical protein
MSAPSIGLLFLRWDITVFVKRCLRIKNISYFGSIYLTFMFSLIYELIMIWNDIIRRPLCYIFFKSISGYKGIAVAANAVICPMLHVKRTMIS